MDPVQSAETLAKLNETVIDYVQGKEKSRPATALQVEGSVDLCQGDSILK
jgi:hypothetical protein